jgi:predicted dienelactone hydrolase
MRYLTCLMTLFVVCAKCLAGISTKMETWTDAARDREIPVKWYLPQAKDQEHPVIVVSHGLGGSRDTMSYACEAWADAGFIVLALQHLGSDEAVWQESDQPRRDIRKAASAENFFLRVDDVKFAISRIEETAKTDESIDATRIGMSGHSFGAITTLAVSGVRYGPTLASFIDPRVRAAVALSPAPPSNVRNLGKAFADVKLPMLHLTGTKDVSIISDTTAADRRVPYRQMNGSPQFLAVWDDADHLVFSGHNTPGSDGAQNAQVRSELVELSILFWKAYLTDDKPSVQALVAKGKSFDRTADFEYKHIEEKDDK